MLPKRCSTRLLFTGKWQSLYRLIASSHLRQSRQYSTGDVNDVAVLGGGITGLAAAYNISKEFPGAKITIYESSPRIGGWLLSKRVEVPEGSIVLEQGPRTLRPTGGSVTAQLIQDLGLENEIISSSKTSPAALNRYIYYPDHLVRLPAPSKDFSFAALFASIITEPLFRGLFMPVLREGFRDKRNNDHGDESVGSFVSRRLSPAIANNLVSAMIHGIYGGDIWKLSIKSIFPLLWEFERRYDSIVLAFAHLWSNDAKLVKKRDIDMLEAMFSSHLPPRLVALFGNAAVYTFRNGIGQLVDRLVERLGQNPKITIKTGTKISRISMGQQQIELDLPNQTKAHHSHMISTISARTLSTLTYLTSSNSDRRVSRLPSFSTLSAATVQVVSLYYPDPNLIPYNGFGYLIPQSVPFSQNPERALGVIFDSSYGTTHISDTLGASQPAAQDSSRSDSASSQQPPILSQDTVPGTKLTVMLGGHLWDGFTYYPSETEALNLATSLLRRHLGITVDPVAYNVALQKDCIPQYTVGHSMRMLSAHRVLRDRFEGRLKVAGSWYSGVGVHDCINSAWRVVKGLRDETKTGLEEFAEEDPWVLLCAKSLRQGKITPWQGPGS